MESASQSRQTDKAKPLISIKHHRKEAGVSSCTVSLVLNNKDRNRVSKAVAQRVRETANQWDTSRTPWRVHCTSRSYVLGFIPMRSPPRHMPGAYWWERRRRARKLGYILLTVSTGNDRELENQEMRGPAAVPRGRFPVCHDVPPCCGGSPPNSKAAPRSSSTAKKESQDSLGLPTTKWRGTMPQSADSGRLQTHRLLRFLNHHYRQGSFAGYRRALADWASPSTNSWSSTWKTQTPLRKPVACSTRSSRLASSASTMCATFIYEAARERSVGIGKNLFRDQHRQPAAHYGRAQTRVDHLGASLTARNGLEAVHQLVAMIDDG